MTGQMKSMDNKSHLISVEVAYATPEAQCVLTLRVIVGSTLQEVIEHSGIQNRFEELKNLENFSLGVFGEVQSPKSTVKPGDRVEIYRPLPQDPKAARRERS